MNLNQERMILKKPMLACALLPPNIEHTNENILKEMSKLKYPVLASLKKDGIRAVKTDILRSRTLKCIPNLELQKRASDIPYGYDMELWSPLLRYDEIESIVMSESHDRSAEIEFHLLDDFNSEWSGYGKRIFYADIDITSFKSEVKYAEIHQCDNAKELLDYFLQYENEEGEGICFRFPDSPYKQGRSTLREQYLVKLSRYIRSECIIYGFEEQMNNINVSKRNGVDKMDRGSFKAGMVGKNTLGAFLCCVGDYDVQKMFKVGTGVGLTNKLRKEIWENKENWVKQTITIKTKGHGMKLLPRSPIYVGLRSEIDI